MKGTAFSPLSLLLVLTVAAVCSSAMSLPLSTVTGAPPSAARPATGPGVLAGPVPGDLRECTIGDAMGNATTDGRPISWKNRDEDAGPAHFVNYVTVTGGTYGILGLGYGSPFDLKMGVNEAGLSLQNALCENMSGTSNYADFKLYALSRTGSIAELRQAIVEDTNGTVNHWNSEPAICAGFSDAHGYATLFELQQRTTTGLTYYEYDPTNSLRLGQFPRQIVARSNTAHLNANGLDNASDDLRYTVARNDLVNYAGNGGLNIWTHLWALFKDCL